MTDEQLDEQVHEAYAQVELSKEAEDRILANLLAAERASRPAPASAARRRKWRWVGPASIAAVLLVGVIVGTSLAPSFSANDAATMDGGVAVSQKAAGVAESEEAAEAAGETAREVAPMSSSESFDAVTYGDVTAEVVVLEDGRSFAIVDVFEVPEELDPGELDWQSATIESTGDPCEVALLEDGTVLVLFEGEDVLYEASPL